MKNTEENNAEEEVQNKRKLRKVDEYALYWLNSTKIRNLFQYLNFQNKIEYLSLSKWEVFSWKMKGLEDVQCQRL